MFSIDQVRLYMCNKMEVVQSQRRNFFNEKSVIYWKLEKEKN